MKIDRVKEKRLMQKLVRSLKIVKKKNGKNVLHLNECDDWVLTSSYGSIQTDGEYWYLYVIDRRWSSVKKELSFMTLTQDGDDEGILRLDRMPTELEAIKIRKILNLRKMPDYTPEQLKALRDQLEENVRPTLPLLKGTNPA